MFLLLSINIWLYKIFEDFLCIKWREGSGAAYESTIEPIIVLA